MHVLQHGAAIPCSPAELVVQGVLGVSPRARPVCVLDVPENGPVVCLLGTHKMIEQCSGGFGSRWK